MNHFPQVDPYIQPFGNIPPFPIDTPNVDWPSIENNLILNTPISQPSLYPNMMDNQEAHMVMLMMQQQQQLQQQQQQQQQQQLQQQQQQQQYFLQNQQPWLLQPPQHKTSIQSPSSASSPLHVSAAPLNIARESDIVLTKRVEVILTINQELIRLCLEHQQMNETREPDITIYKSRLQSNLTYLATMADISTTRPEENTKIPIPPNLSPLPPPYTMTAQRIHKLLLSANQLFMNEEVEIMSPFPQAYNNTIRQRQQQYNSGMNSVGSMSSNSSHSNMSPHHLHYPLLKNNQNVDIVQQDTGNYTMDDPTMMMMYSLPHN